MHDELAQRRRPLVAAPPVHHEQPAEVRELRDGEVRGQRRRLPLLRGGAVGSVGVGAAGRLEAATPPPNSEGAGDGRGPQPRRGSRAARATRPPTRRPTAPEAWGAGTRPGHGLSRCPSHSSQGTTETGSACCPRSSWAGFWVSTGQTSAHSSALARDTTTTWPGCQAREQPQGVALCGQDSEGPDSVSTARPRADACTAAPRGHTHLPLDADPAVGGLDHAHVVASVPWGGQTAR